MRERLAHLDEVGRQRAVCPMLQDDMPAEAIFHRLRRVGARNLCERFMLFVGLGKTTLVQRVARELGFRFGATPGPGSALAQKMLTFDLRFCERV